MLPGIIPVGVTVPTFSYKEGFAGSLASGSSTVITLTAAPSQYRWVIISAGCGQSVSNTPNIISLSVPGYSVIGQFASTSADSGGTGTASTANGLFRFPTGSSFTLGLSSTLGTAMNYTIGVLEIPTTGLQYVTSGAFSGSSSFNVNGPAFQGGILLSSFFGQGGTGTWSNITFTNAYKIPIPSSAQEALAFSYPPINGTINVQSTNSAAFNRIFLISSFAPI